jgi:hypothetical protein
MEFASEMVIKAALNGERITQRPATLSRDCRGRGSHLRPWRDGWRHLRYLLMLSPTGIFAAPAALLASGGLAILLLAAAALVLGQERTFFLGNYWVILAGAMLGLAHSLSLFAAATHLYGAREGYRRPSQRHARWTSWVSLETMLGAGLITFMAGMAILALVIWYWSRHSYGPIGSVLPAVAGTTLLVVGAQNALGGFLLAVIGGNEADFLQPEAPKVATTAAERRQSAA